VISHRDGEPGEGSSDDEANQLAEQAGDHLYSALKEGRYRGSLVMADSVSQLLSR